LPAAEATVIIEPPTLPGYSSEPATEFESCVIGSISMVVNRIHLHLALVVLKDAILLQTAKCTASSILCFSTMCLCKFVCIVEQNVPGLGILLFFFISLPVPGQLFAPTVASHLEYVLVLR